ncbi:ABC transporter ATP-binding protein [Cellulomonas fengjieae]|uniref:ABC transporter ATP-binding protein n=1 Tax=Cellulomonas fengjieae TaxID=2819978 RepID=A0ABS3SLG4_9CELL|nr:ABC transporter ATP-binding protein [Cellulomonas fengjieae]MBO3086583.1 ABC transporter ATP-binding protein [Cellulomonas fengjieae]QVI66564.1 ABC transporter ATP-binding protein [Cellulomonas fengjieae]
MNAIEVHGLHKTYDGRAVVAGIDLTVAQGEVFALLGPNGAGKTTTIEILEGHRPRDGGAVSVLGRDPGQADRWWRSRVGIVLQQIGDAGDLTVGESVRQFTRFYPDPADPDELLELCGLTAQRSARVATLSGGQRRRLDVALGLVGNPELLFLDEPTTGFDPEARRQFWGVIRTLASRGLTVVLTTHYLEEAEVLADRLAVLVAGRIVAEGTPGTLGGRDRELALVTWNDASGEHRVRTPDPSRELGALAGAQVTDLRVNRPSLEEIYLDLIGARP